MFISKLNTSTLSAKKQIPSRLNGSFLSRLLGSDEGLALSLRSLQKTSRVLTPILLLIRNYVFLDNITI